MASHPAAIPHDAARARHPDASGTVVRDGVRIVWDRYEPADAGPATPTVVLAPTWSIVHARLWKAQIPYLARHFRVVTWDGRGNGRSDRPADAAAYDHAAFAADGLSVLDATSTERAILVGLSAGASWSLLLAAEHPDRVQGVVFIAPALPVGRLPRTSDSPPSGFDVERESYEGWDLYNRHAWRLAYARFVAHFFAQCFTEPHSTKQIEDCVGWACETDAETLIRTQDAGRLLDHASLAAVTRAVRCPTLVIHGTDDDIVEHAVGVGLAELLGCPLLTIEGGGHIPPARDPVRVNLAIRTFVESVREGQLA
ncbi:MAG TPA: alpha/beta hydrolase [Candidatus Limnocylindrales bacterium]